MEHLPQPEMGLLTDLQVPFVTYHKYDRADFETYPQRCGFSLEEPFDRSRSSREVASLLQAWLYYGLLANVLDNAEFKLETSVGDKTICLSEIYDMLDEWQNKLRGLGVKKCCSYLRTARSKINRASQLSRLFDVTSYSADQEYASVLLSVKTLIITLAHFHNALQPDNLLETQQDALIPIPSQQQVQALDSPDVGPAARLLATRMIGGGWCPQAVLRACTSYDYLTVSYMSLLRRTRTHGHEACTSSTCKVYDTNQEDYITRHVKDDCTCQHVSVDSHEIKAIIEAHDIPLIEVVLNKSEIIEVHTKRHLARSNLGLLRRTPFVAVSHLWKDGLGNPIANSLPACQLKHLIEVFEVSRLTIWIDTFCIPVIEGDLKIRQQAIDSISRVFDQSSSVVVLDQELQMLGSKISSLQTSVGAQDSPSPADTTALCRLRALTLCSAWNSRCWTYQEAVLGAKILIDTSEGLSQIFPSAVFPEVLQSGRETVTHRAGQRWKEWRDIRSPFGPTSEIRVFITLIQGNPVSDCFMLGFRLLCGKQAWLKISSAYRGHHLGQLLPAACRLGIGIAWLGMSILAGILMVPCYVLFFIVILSLTVIMWLPVLVAKLTFIDISPMSAAQTLDMEFALQLGTYLAADIQPPRITNPVETGALDVARAMRVRQFAETWNAMTWRSTTKPEDVHAIMANLSDASAGMVLSLPTLPARMRALAGCHTQLPLDLLFNRTTHRDPDNPWLPVAPQGDLISTAAQPKTIHVTTEHIEIRLADYNSEITILCATGARPQRGTIKLYVEDRSALLWLATDGNVDLSGDGQRMVFIVEASPETLKQDCTSMLRGARLMATSCIDGCLQCEYLGPLRLTREQSWNAMDRSLGVELLPADIKLQIPFRKAAKTLSEYRQRTSIGEYALLIAFIGGIYHFGVTLMLIIAATQMGWEVLYIGYPIWAGFMLCIFSLGVVLGYEDILLSTGLAQKSESWLLRGTKTWLANVSMNLAFHGQPSRFYHMAADRVGKRNHAVMYNRSRAV